MTKKMIKYSANKAFKNLTKYIIILTSFIIAIFFPLHHCIAQQAPTKTLLALSKNDHTLSIINPSTLQVIATVPVGTDPHEVIASTDGKTAYVTIYGGGSLHELDVIDLIANKSIAVVDTKPLMGPHGLTFANGAAWFTAEGSKAIGRYDAASGKIDWVMGTGQDRTHMVFVSDDGKKVYTTNVSSGTVSILVDSLVQPGNFAPPGAKPHHDWFQTIVQVSKGSEGFDVSPDGKELWTAAADDGMISIVDLQGKKLNTKVDAKAFGANRLKFTPDGKKVLISSLRNGDVYIYDAKTHQEIKRLNTGSGAAGILVDTDSSRAFIGCTGDGYVALIDLKTYQITGHIAIAGADGLAWALR